MIEAKRPPVKSFEVLIAHGPYRKGDVIQPTGMYRQQLMVRGIIREIVPAETREVTPQQLFNRDLGQPVDTAQPRSRRRA